VIFAAYAGSYLTTLRHNLSPPSSRVKQFPLDCVKRLSLTSNLGCVTSQKS